MHNLQYVMFDIALIKLSQKLDFDGKENHLAPVCLAQDQTKLTKNCVASGFGFVNTSELKLLDK